MNTATETELTKDERAAIVAALGLSIRSEFVPFSRSRDAKEKRPSLNWHVTVVHRGRDVLTTDYSAGCGHCPAYSDPRYGRPGFMSIDRDNAVRRECETGKTHRAFSASGAAIEPGTLNVLYSLAMDSEVLDAGGFEQWAADLGYDTDSRKAESIYRACLDIALKLRAALGDSGMAELRRAFEGY